MKNMHNEKYQIKSTGRRKPQSQSDSFYYPQIALCNFTSVLNFTLIIWEIVSLQTFPTTTHKLSFMIFFGGGMGYGWYLDQ